MNTIEVEVSVGKVTASVDIEDVIWEINKLPMKNRWNYIGKIINGVQLDLTNTTDEQKELIKQYLTNKLLLF